MRGDVPDYIDGNDNWNDPKLLTAYRDQFQRDAESLAFLAGIEPSLVTLVGGTAAGYSKVLTAEAAAARGGLFGLTALVILRNGETRLRNNLAQVRALNARLKYLKICGGNGN